MASAGLGFIIGVQSLAHGRCTYVSLENGRKVKSLSKMDIY